MRDIALNERLESLAGLCPAGVRLCDVGSGHALLPCALYARGRIRSAIITDVRPGPLELAKQNVRELCPEAEFTFALCDGLDGVDSEEYDTVVMAGMGGATMVGILGRAPHLRDSGYTVIMQPQTARRALRIWLRENGYEIRGGKIVRDSGKLYTAMVVGGGDAEPCPPHYYHVGYENINDPLFGEYMDEVVSKLQKRLNGLYMTATDDPRRTEIPGLERDIELVRGIGKMGLV